MRILQKTPYIDSKGIRVNFGDIVYRRRGKEAIPSYSYTPDELYCEILKLKHKLVILGGINPFNQNREQLRRLCYLLKNGFINKEYPKYLILCYTDAPLEELISQDADVKYNQSILKYVDILVERHDSKRIIKASESLKQGKVVIYDK